VTRLDKGDVIDDEDPGLLDPREVLDGSLRAQLAVAPTIKGPGAAEGAIPGTAAGELDRSTGVEDADEVATPVAEQLTGRVQLIEAVHEDRRRAASLRAHRARHRG